MLDCMLNIYNSKTKQSEWYEGRVIDFTNGDINEDFERIDVATDNGVFYGCDPHCVIYRDNFFTAYHKNLGNIKYKFLGREKTNGYNITLLNINDNSLTSVEPEWFNQRRIKTI